jgi:hypothetical protein
LDVFHIFAVRNLQKSDYHRCRKCHCCRGPLHAIARWTQLSRIEGGSSPDRGGPNHSEDSRERWINQRRLRTDTIACSQSRPDIDHAAFDRVPVHGDVSSGGRPKFGRMQSLCDHGYTRRPLRDGGSIVRHRHLKRDRDGRCWRCRRYLPRRGKCWAILP